MKVKVKKMTSSHPFIYRKSNDHPLKFPFDEDHSSDIVDDEDDCIICSKSLLNHSEEEANECYSTLIKKQIFRKELSRKQLEVP